MKALALITSIFFFAMLSSSSNACITNDDCMIGKVCIGSDPNISKHGSCKANPIIGGMCKLRLLLFYGAFGFIGIGILVFGYKILSSQVGDVKGAVTTIILLIFGIFLIKSPMTIYNAISKNSKDPCRVSS
jgi:hypothetical protein